LAWLVWLMIGLGAVTLAAYLVLPGGDPRFVAVGGLFSLWVVALAAGQALNNRQLPTGLRVGLGLLAGLWLYRRLFLEFAWISGWLPILVALATLLALRSWRLLGAGVLVAAMVIGLNYDFFAQAYDNQISGDESQGNMTRLDVWSHAIAVIGDQILLGLGPAGYAPYYMTYSPDQALSSHSGYLDILAQTGLVGSLFFLWFLVALFRLAFAALRRWTEGLPAGLAHGGLAGLAGMTVAMALGDWVIPFVYNQTLAGFRYTLHSWIILGAVAALASMRDSGAANA
jgi:O-antigen ligase